MRQTSCDCLRVFKGKPSKTSRSLSKRGAIRRKPKPSLSSKRRGSSSGSSAPIMTSVMPDSSKSWSKRLRRRVLTERTRPSTTTFKPIPLSTATLPSSERMIRCAGGLGNQIEKAISRMAEDHERWCSSLLSLPLATTASSATPTRSNPSLPTPPCSGPVWTSGKTSSKRKARSRSTSSPKSSCGTGREIP